MLLHKITKSGKNMAITNNSNRWLHSYHSSLWHIDRPYSNPGNTLPSKCHHGNWSDDDTGDKMMMMMLDSTPGLQRLGNNIPLHPPYPCVAAYYKSFHTPHNFHNK